MARAGCGRLFGASLCEERRGNAVDCILCNLWVLSERIIAVSLASADVSPVATWRGGMGVSNGTSDRLGKTPRPGQRLQYV